MEYMDARMQDQYDAWDAQMREAHADLKAYTAAMLRVGGEEDCLAIERRWGLEGYPPQQVSEMLDGLASGKPVGFS